MADAVKRPFVGGGYAIWYRSNMARIKQEVQDGFSEGAAAIAKKGSEMWKSLSEEEKLAWKNKYYMEQAKHNEQRTVCAPIVKSCSDDDVGPSTIADNNLPIDFGVDQIEAPEAAKKPVGGAYGAWYRVNMLEIKKKVQWSSEGIVAIARTGSELWRSMSDDDKLVWAKRYEEQWNAYVAVRSVKTEKTDDIPIKPKVPVGGAYGQWYHSNIADIHTKLQESGLSGRGSISKQGSSMWALLPEDEKAIWKKRFEEEIIAYKASVGKSSARDAPGIFFGKQKTLMEMLARNASQNDEAAAGVPRVLANLQTPIKRERQNQDVTSTPPIQKRCKIETPISAPADKMEITCPAHIVKGSKGRKASFVEIEPLDIPAAVLKQAKKFGYDSAIVNLAGRPEIIARRCKGSELLKALKASGGLVNKAKAAILEM
eukprot:TRINITY_DN74571_c0_g1_i1.p1 TRINITY_DN74571_c0_g1~~TRINITY_DN74571_c0_g1_i1.p1  ORF type:complete len:450 (+),score=94.76 TRINITY_DN74571_c0_g1_i1:67-1350(+)